MGFSPARKVKEGHLSLSWCLRGELGAGGVPLWDFWGEGGGSMSSHWMWSQ